MKHFPDKKLYNIVSLNNHEELLNGHRVIFITCKNWEAREDGDVQNNRMKETNILNLRISARCESLKKHAEKKKLEKRREDEGEVRGFS